MKVNRRAFLSLAALSGASYLETSWSHAPIEFFSRPYYAIQQGFTNATSSEFSILAGVNERLFIEVESPTGERILPSEIKIVENPFSAWVIYKVFYENLEPATDHLLQVKGENDYVWDQRVFRTVDLNSAKTKIAVISCLNDFLHRKSMWQSLATHDPDYIFCVGDAVYADWVNQIEVRSADPKQLWHRFVQSRNRLAFFKAPRLIPLLGVWDDHDFGANNADRHYQYKEEAKENYLNFFAQSDFHSELKKGPGLSMAFSAFGKDFIFLDGRYFRTNNDKDSEETVFGIEQEKWLFNHLETSVRPTWLMTGSQWFGGNLENESYECTHPRSFAKFREKLSKVNIPIQFVSGDVHFSEIMKIEKEQIGQETIEITSSSMHSMTFPGWHNLRQNPRRIEATSSHNFSLVQFHEGENFSGSIRTIGSGGNTIYSHSI